MRFDFAEEMVERRRREEREKRNADLYQMIIESWEEDVLAGLASLRGLNVEERARAAHELSC